MTSAGGNLNFERYAQGDGAGGGGRRRAAPPREPLGKLFDRQPPQSIEAEMSLLGSMILDPRVISDVLQVVRGAETFYHEGHGQIYQALIELADKHNAGDLELLRSALKDKGIYEQVGGDQYLVRLAQDVPAAVNAPHYARIVAEKHRLRRLIDAAGQILYDTYHAGEATGDDAKTLVDIAEQRIFEIAQEEQISDTEPLSALVQAEYERLMEQEDGANASTGVATGFADLDHDLGGLQPGEMIILAARPSMGKTALALNLAEQIAMGTDQPGSAHALRPRVPVGVFSLEMSKSALAQRLLSSWSGIESQRIRSGRLHSRPPNDEYKVLLKATQQLASAPIFVDDTPGLTIMALRARARRMVAQHKVGCLMVDYLQLLTAPGSARESRQVEVSAISRGVKALARELKVPIIALSQLNRGPESREQNKPRLSDLRESGSLEQDADVVLLLHREAYYHVADEEWKENNADKLNLAEIIIAKQRNGPTGTVKLAWDNTTTRFRSYAEGSGEYVPPRGDVFVPPMEQGGMGSGAMAPPAPPTNAGGWHAGRGTGPVADFRDGGGPDREDEGEEAPF